ncbi:MAG: phosphoglycerate kinase [Candidatus Levybacteria bacterium]|nr:phosphoglycerate kinase [Candidatus Levybacteria bacterium]
MIRYISDTEPINKRVLLRVDFNVSLHGDYTIADDARIRQSLPTIKLLLQNHNKPILLSHLDRPKGRDPNLSLAKVAEQLQSYLPGYTVTLVKDFITDRSAIDKQKEDELLMLENIRYYEGEKKNDPTFAASLASLAEIYVDDAFAVCHREDASVVGVPRLLPSYGGLLLQKEIEAMDLLLDNPQHPFLAILAGAKISTKLPLIHKLLPLVDMLLLGGGLANTLLRAKGIQIGKSICEPELLPEAKTVLEEAKEKLILPIDALVGKSPEDPEPVNKPIDIIQPEDMILDIGEETRRLFGEAISQAKTIVWNGPVGYFENPIYRQGSKFICKAITGNTEATSVVGGGETLAAIAGSGELDKITHISTGGGAMLEYLEKGSLPGIDALNTK